MWAMQQKAREEKRKLTQEEALLYIQVKTGIYMLWKLVHIHCYLLQEQQKK